MIIGGYDICLTLVVDIDSDIDEWDDGLGEWIWDVDEDILRGSWLCWR